MMSLPGSLSEDEAWLVLAGVDGAGDRIFWHLVGSMGGARPVLEVASRGTFGRDAPKLPRGDGEVSIPAPVVARIETVARAPDLALARLDALGLWTVTPLDRAFPPRLRILDPPPPVLYGWGERDSLRAGRSVAVVGTRRPTLQGRALAARIAARLAETGSTVISGLAIGIDGAAHAAVAERHSPTVAVIGGGHARPGPRAHRGLVERILASGGAVVSELPPDASPTRGTFPRRNRLISALSDAVVVVEAPARSGALITARHALEQGRQLFVAPGRPGDPAVAGCLALLRETPARPIVGLDELVADLGYAGRMETGRPASLDRGAALGLLGPAERAVAEVICGSPGSADAVASRTGLPPPVVAGAITLLLLRGWIQPSGPAYLPAGPLVLERHSRYGSSAA